MKIKIRTGDTVYVLAGKDKGKTGVVKSVLKDKHRVIVSGIQVVRCFNKRKLLAGGPETKEMPIDISNVAHIDPKDSKPTRVKIQMNENKKELVSKRSGAIIRTIVQYKEISND